MPLVKPTLRVDAMTIHTHGRILRKSEEAAKK
jgi:hypothetical protein